MRPPPLLLLQACNALANFQAFIVIKGATSLWSERGWTSLQTGLALALANFAYAATAALGGRVADRFGRGVACVAGTLIAGAGCVLALATSEPVPVLVGLVLSIGGTAIYFPGCAGLFSDAEGARPGAAVAAPLHAKVNRYNLGWASGIFLGFVCAALMADLPLWSLFLAAAASCVVQFLCLAPYLRLPAQPPAPHGDRAPHPALKRLTFMARIAILLGCTAGMGMLSQVEQTLRAAGLTDAALRRTSSMIMAAYPLGYVGMFTLLGQWGGWVLRPWRLWALQLGILIGSLVFLALAMTGTLATPALMLATAMIGSGFGAVYVGSLYYSLRLPDGAARAAGLHETCIGIGNTSGPLIAGLFLSAWATSASAPSTHAMFGLGVFMVVGTALTLLWQVALIPRAMRAR
ncbi:MAG TPA: MFS transporter [Planctomycetota bacterium]|nr:MFS transporter [Planctomycetota bacterium]